MFKKKPQIKSAAPLRSSDRRRLADSIIQDHGLQEPQSEEQTAEQKAQATAARTALRSSLLPENVQTARFSTTHGPALKQVNGTVYLGAHNGEDARVLWWQIDGRMYPSVYTLWKHPAMVPLLHTPGVVVEKLKGGADLMTPGLAGGPPFPEKASKGSVVAIASTDSPSVPLAVGICEIDVAGLQQVRGAKGMAVENLHWAGDELWNYNQNGKAGVPPPKEIDGWLRNADEDLNEKTADMSLDDDGEGGGVPIDSGETQTDANLKSAEETSRPSKDGNVSSSQQAEDPTEHNQMSQKAIDDAFRNAFLYGVHHHKTTNPNQPNFGLVFPLNQSIVMSTLIQPFLPSFTPEQSQQLQIKKTSWKNIKKFIKALDKGQIVKSKEKDGHETVIWDIDFSDAAVSDFKPYPLPKKETMAGTSQGRGDKATDQIDTADESVGQKLEVKSFFRPTSKLSPIFAASNKSLFSAAEIRELVGAYVESENLVSATNKRLVKLNPTLADAVFDGSGSLDKEVLAKGSVPRDALTDRILHAMSPSYSILRRGADPSTVKARSGAPPKVHITLETRSGNKTVTKVSGLEAYHVNPRPLADELRKVCAGSTSVEPLAGASKKNEKPVEEVMVQGPQKDAVVKALERRGVNARWVEVMDKTKGKKR